jgi:hypothetical protein
MSLTVFSRAFFIPVRNAIPFNLNSAVKEDENGADAQKHEGF